MKRLIPIVLLMATAAGCATSTMKSTPFYSGSERVYTGKPEDRVNLWPLAYYREPALSVLWPLFSQTDDHLAIRPIYSQYKQTGKPGAYDEFNFLWPLCQFDTRHDCHRIFPLFWGERHFDLFPLVWWRYDSSFTLFPLVRWKRDGEFNVFPLWWSDRRRKLLLPFYFQDENSLTVLPFYGKTSHVDGYTEWIGPYGRHRSDRAAENFDWCIPFYYRDADSFTTPLFGWNRVAGSSWAFPFYFAEPSNFYSLPWCSGKDGEDDFWFSPLLLSGGASSAKGSFNAFLLGLGGQKTKADGDSGQWLFPLFYRDSASLMTPLFGYDREVDGSWIFPFYYRDSDSFLSMAYWRKWKTADDGSRTMAHGTFPFWYADDTSTYSPLWCTWRDGTASGWIAPPLLSWGGRDGEDLSRRFLLGLGGCDRKADGKFADWFLPFYYRNEENFISLPWCEVEGATVIPPLLTICDKESVCNPLFGWDTSAHPHNWVFPLYYWDKTLFASLAYVRSYSHDGLGSSVTHVVPPLLSWVESSERGDKKMRFLLGLGGVDTKINGDVDCSWTIPLFYNCDCCFISLPFAHVKDEFTYVTPFIGVTHKEHKKGAWLWPLFGWAKDDRMDAAEAQMNADRLDPKIAVKTHATEWQKGSTSRWYEVTGEIRAHDSSWRLSGLSTSARWICWSADEKTVTAEDESDFGNFFAYKSESCRTVKFDAKTREKLSDEEESESGVFCNLLWHSEHEASKGHEYDLKSILWRFWHYEKLNGDVSVDSFPFFTYDSKTNGYSKTSLCWRLFRNEYDPKTDRRSVDFLFIPVWR